MRKWIGVIALLALFGLVGCKSGGGSVGSDGEDFVILWTSPPIVNDAITVRSDLNKDFIKKLQNAYLNAAKDDFPSFSKYVKLYWPHPENMSYLPAQDSMYDQLRNIAGSVKDLKLSK